MIEAEFQSTVLKGIEAQKAHGEALTTDLASAQAEILKLKTALNGEAEARAAIQKTVGSLAKTRTATRSGNVSEDCARHLGAISLLAAINQNKLEGGTAKANAEGLFKDITGIEVKTALSSSDIPLPVEYGSQVVELVSQWGAARQFGTVYPLGAGSVKLPKLTTDTAFALFAVSASITEVSPAFANVTFTPEKFGGLIRLPSEINDDSIVDVGQFLARYAARQIAYVEDWNFFRSTGAGSTKNGSVKGLCESTITNSKVSQQASTKTKTSDMTLAGIRGIRAIVDAPIIGHGAYYMHPSMEQALSGLNTAGDKPYMASSAQGATLDGYPVRWVDSMPVYSTSAQGATVFALFGDLSYQYLGVRGGIRFDTSKEAAFTTDEILVRALERFTIGLMANGAVAGLQTAAS